MGAECCAEAESVTAEVPEQMKDLPAKNYEAISDIYERFEAMLPFNRIGLPEMMQKIEEAEQACGGSGFVTLEQLRKVLPTPAWADLLDTESVLSKVLLSPQFKDSKKGTGPDQVDADTLKMFSLLHCNIAKPKKSRDKAIAFYGILQEGGLSAHEQISAGDKDFAPVFKKLCTLVTVDLFELTEACG